VKAHILALTALLLAGGAPAATWHVSPDGSGDFPTIQAAIDASADGDVIALSDGIFSGAGNRDLDFGGRAITVESSSGHPDACVIDCEGSESDPHRGVLFRSGESSATRLEGITIRNGYVTGDEEDGMGAGILCVGASPVLHDLRIERNRAHNGGGIACRHGASPEIRRCRFEGNRAIVNYDGDGGGLHCFDASNPDVSECVFVDNLCDSQGGAVFCYDHSDASFRNCTFVRNGAVHPSYGRGGAISLYVASSPRVERCIIAFTVAGGAFYCYSSNCAPVISCSDVFANTGGDQICGVDAGGNFSADPLFCDADGGDFRIGPDSPCAPASSGACDLVGALPVGCGTPAIAVDIKPGSPVNSVNPRSKGKIPVAILTTADFDATSVDPATVTFGPAGAAIAHAHGHVSDVDSDGDLDLLLHFKTQETGIACGDTIARLTGATWSGDPIEGSDSIVTVGCHEPRVGVAPYRLSAATPNPFGRSTTIRYELDRPTTIDLRVYDVTGRLIRVVEKASKPAGGHTAVWDGLDDAGRRAARGTYFIRLTAGETTQTRKVVDLGAR